MARTIFYLATVFALLLHTAGAHGGTSDGFDEDGAPVSRRAGDSANSQTRWDHNGSEMRLEASGQNRKFIYVSPRAGLPVTSGMLSFEGQRLGKRYKGRAYVFGEKCGPASFSVEGEVADDDRSVVLRGDAPIRGADCRVTATRSDILVYSLKDSPPVPPQSAPPSERSTAAEQPNVSSPTSLDLGQLFLQNSLPCVQNWLKPGVDMHRGTVSLPLIEGRREACRATAAEFGCQHRSIYGSYLDSMKTYYCLKECARSDGCAYKNIRFNNVEEGRETTFEADFSMGSLQMTCSFIDQSWYVNLDLHETGVRSQYKLYASTFSCGKRSW